MFDYPLYKCCITQGRRRNIFFRNWSAVTFYFSSAGKSFHIIIILSARNCREGKTKKYTIYRAERQEIQQPKCNRYT